MAVPSLSTLVKWMIGQACTVSSLGTGLESSHPSSNSWRLITQLSRLSLDFGVNHRDKELN
jgi:hypothetical protein